MIRIIVTAAAIITAAWVGNNWIQVTRYRVMCDAAAPTAPASDPASAEAGPGVAATDVGAPADGSGAGYAPEAPGLRILQISDLHGKRFGPGARRLLRRIDSLDYDIIAVTGDFITGGLFPRGLKNALRLAEELTKRAPVYYVTGNHEATSPQFPHLEAGLKELGIAVLRADATTITVKGRAYTILGLDDQRFFEDDPRGHPRGSRDADARALARYGRALEELAAEAADGAAGDAPATPPTFVPQVLVSHRPEILDLYAAARLDLVLTGHVHGGQFRIPGVGGLFAPDQGFFPRFDAGVFHSGRTTMVISRGLGASIIPVRIFNRPELVLIELVQD
jgi:uncharacterized protein